MKSKFFVFIALFSLAATSCVNNDVYFQYYQIPPKEAWKADKEFSFKILIEDTLASYNVFISVRNTSKYPYQNLWLFTSELLDNNEFANDTIDFYLADQRGKWLGRGVGDMREMSVFYRQNIKFDKKCLYEIKIKHGMRDESLMGINDIGVRVEKVDF